MKYTLLLYLLMVFTFYNTTEMHLAVKRTVQNYGNTSLSDLDYEDYFSSEEIAKQCNRPTNELPPNNVLNETIEKQNYLEDDSHSGKHRNVIKMICDSDSLISQMTLHMNFLDNSSNNKQNYFTFEKALDPYEVNNVSLSFPEPEDKLINANDTGHEERLTDVRLKDNNVILKNEAVTVKSWGTVDSICTEDGYDSNLSSGKLNETNQPSYETKCEKKICRGEKNKFPSRHRPACINRKKGIHSSNIFHKNIVKNDIEVKSIGSLNRDPKLKVEIQSHLETLKTKKKKNEGKLHFPDGSKLQQPMPVKSSPNPVYQEDGNELLQLKDKFNENEYDTIKIKGAGVLNNSTKFKQYKLDNGQYHKLNPVKSSSEKLLFCNKSNKNKKGSILIDSDQDQYLNDEIIAQAKSDLHSAEFDESHSTIVSIFRKKNKPHIPRNKVIQNLKFILTQDNEGDKRHTIIEEETKGTTHNPFIDLDSSKAIGGDYVDNRVKLDDIAIEENFDNESGDKKNSDELKIYDTAAKKIVSNDLSNAMIEDGGTKQIKPKDLIDKSNRRNAGNVRNRKLHRLRFKTGKPHLEKNNDHKKLSRKHNVRSFDSKPHIKNILNYRKDIAKKLSQLQDELEKYTSGNKMSDDKVELIEKNAFSKRGVPSQSKSDLSDMNENEQVTTLNLITGADKLFFRNENEHLSIKREKPWISQGLNMKKYRRSYPRSKKVKRHAVADNNYLKAYDRFLRDVNLFETLYDNNTASPK